MIVRTATRIALLAAAGALAGPARYRCEDSMEQVAARDRLTGSDVRSQTVCKLVE
jgi:hypothetical protein